MEETHKDESFMTKKMEEMKIKNEEMFRRHMEIEQDKILADQFSNTVKAQRKENVGEKKGITTRPQRTKSSVTERQSASLHREPEEKWHHRFSDKDGPPPDPNFNFLSDPSRNRSKSSDDDNWRNSDKRNSDRRDQPRRHRNNYGGSDFNNVKSTMQKQRASFKKELSEIAPKSNDLRMQMQMTGKERIEYEEWKQERDIVDQARIQRQRASDGKWRREWDSHKAFKFNFDAQPPESEIKDLCKSFKQQRIESTRVPASSVNLLPKSELSDAKSNGSSETQSQFSTENKRSISQGDGKLSVTVHNKRPDQMQEKTQSIVRTQEQNTRVTDDGDDDEEWEDVSGDDSEVVEDNDEE